MTQDEPERVKVEANILRQYEEFQSLPTIEALKHRYAPVWIDIRDLLSLIDAQRHAISVSEKRAESLELEIVRLRKQLYEAGNLA